MLCRNCGAELPSEAAFCPSCGQPVGEPSVDDLAEAPDDQSHASLSSESGAEEAPHKRSALNAAFRDSRRKGRRKMPPLLLAVLIAALIALTACTAYYVYIEIYIPQTQSQEEQRPQRPQKPIKARPLTFKKNTNDAPEEQGRNYSIAKPMGEPAERQQNESPEAAPAAASSASTAASSNDHLLADSNTRYYSRNELEALDNETLYYARNEIYARHERQFKNADLQSFFDSKSWYNGTVPPESFSDDVLNDFERKNAELMFSIEEERNSPYLK